MDILGIGGWELVVVIIIMLIVAGPKRMIAWSYTLGRYIGIVRGMWAETAKQLQRELDESGIDVQVPTNLPTRQTLNNEIRRAAAPLTKPLQESLDSVKTTVNETKQATKFSTTPTTPAAPATPAPAPEKPVPQPAPQKETPAPAADGANNSRSDFGTWSAGEGDKTS